MKSPIKYDIDIYLFNTDLSKKLGNVLDIDKCIPREFTNDKTVIILTERANKP